MKQSAALLFTLAVLSAAQIHAHEAATEMAESAQVWLASLDETQRDQATYELADAEREAWGFVPKPFEGEGMRGGLTLNAMRPDQRHLAYALLSSGLSHRGYTTALEIMSLEQVLWEIENHAEKRNTLMYYFSIFGDPASGNWGWRVEGHHLSMNFTIAGDKVVATTPIFFASNPGEVPSGPRQGLRVLADEEDQARSLIHSLTDAQRQKALIDETAPKEILTEALPAVTAFADGAGLPYSDLDDSQKKLFDELIEVYVRRVRADVADEDLAKIDAAGRDAITFSWAGGTEPGQGHYYRVQGTTFLLEYCNVQNDAKHVHSVWRDFDGDFGRDVLREHFKTAHKAP